MPPIFEPPARPPARAGYGVESTEESAEESYARMEVITALEAQEAQARRQARRAQAAREVREAMDAMTDQETHVLPTHTLRGAGLVPGGLRAAAAYEAASLSTELLDAEMAALGEALGRWRDERGMSYRTLAEEASRLLPPELKRRVTNSTLQRWISDPRHIRVSHLAALRATVAALGYTMYDVADVFALARGRILQERYGASNQEETLTSAQARWDRERELLAHFRTLEPAYQDAMVAQARALTTERRQRAARVRRGTPPPALPVTYTTDQADEALGAFLLAVGDWEQRAAREREAEAARRVDGAGRPGESPTAPGGGRGRKRTG